MSKTNIPEKRILKALDLARKYGQIDGDHHKLWVIDQMCRCLLGGQMEYSEFVKEACRGSEGPDTYSWDSGIAP